MKKVPGLKNQKNDSPTFEENKTNALKLSNLTQSSLPIKSNKPQVEEPINKVEEKEIPSGLKVEPDASSQLNKRTRMINRQARFLRPYEESSPSNAGW